MLLEERSAVMGSITLGCRCSSHFPIKARGMSSEPTWLPEALQPALQPTLLSLGHRHWPWRRLTRAGCALIGGHTRQVMYPQRSPVGSEQAEVSPPGVLTSPKWQQ